MNSKFKKLLMMVLVTVLLLGFSSGLLAHEMVLDFPQQVESGEEVEIEFFFGHYPAYEDYEHSFFGTLAENAELMVVNEEGDVSELDFNLENNRYRASFTPQSEGVYWVVANGPRGVVDRADGGGGMQLRFYDAKAPLIVGEHSEINLAATPLGVELISEGAINLEEGSTAELIVSYLGEAVGEQELTVVTPSEQVRELRTDTQGKIELEFDEKGSWFIHIGNLTDLDRQGRAYAEASTELIEYDRVRYNSALYLEVEEQAGFLQRLFGW